LGKKATNILKKLPEERLRDIEAGLLTAAEPLVETPYFLVSANLERESGQWYVRMYATRPDGSFSLSDCEQFSRKVEPAVDAYMESLEEFKEVSYSLEVSSPGLFRTLTTDRELLFFQGRSVRVEYAESERFDEGILVGFDSEIRAVTLQSAPNPEDPEASPVTTVIPLRTPDVTIHLNPVIHLPE
jgi:ribosome maturation factor RimP